MFTTFLLDMEKSFISGIVCPKSWSRDDMGQCFVLLPPRFSIYTEKRDYIVALPVAFVIQRSYPSMGGQHAHHHCSVPRKGAKKNRVLYETSDSTIKTMGKRYRYYVVESHSATSRTFFSICLPWDSTRIISREAKHLTFLTYVVSGKFKNYQAVV